mgnify:CR=1 FL=1
MYFLVQIRSEFRNKNGFECSSKNPLTPKSFTEKCGQDWLQSVQVALEHKTRINIKSATPEDVHACRAKTFVLLITVL